MILTDFLSSNNITVETLIDTGSSRSLITSKFANKLGVVLEPNNHIFTAAGNHKLASLSCAQLDFKLGSYDTIFSMKFNVLDNLPYDAVVGLDFLQQNNFDISLKDGCLLHNENPILFMTSSKVLAKCDMLIPAGKSVPVPIAIPRLKEGSTILISLSQCVPKLFTFSPNLVVPGENYSDTSFAIKAGKPIGEFQQIWTKDIRQLENTAVHKILTLDAAHDHIPVSKLPALNSLLKEFGDVFSKGLHDIGRTNILDFEIHTGNASPIRQKSYRHSPTQKEEIEKQLDEMLKSDIITQSKSPWASPVLLVKKSDGTWRFCIDFRKLNAVTTKDSFPMPNITDLLEQLNGATQFSKLDLASGYWQVEVRSEDREKTAFITPSGLYEFKVLPFGLSNAPSMFNRLMGIVLREHQKYATAYLDDIVIFSKNEEEHLIHIKAVLTTLRLAGLKVKGKKCEFFNSEMKFLGHIVSAKGVKTDPATVQAVSEMPLPKDIKTLQSFLGLASYYRRFVKNFSIIAAPLHALLRKDVKFIIGEDENSAFAALKECLQKAPVLIV